MPDDFLIARNTEPGSTLPYLLRVPLGDGISSRRDLKLRSCATVGTCRREGSDWARLDSQPPAKAF
jgi:hypothetical protein